MLLAMLCYLDLGLFFLLMFMLRFVFYLVLVLVLITVRNLMLVWALSLILIIFFNLVAFNQTLLGRHLCAGILPALAHRRKYVLNGCNVSLDVSARETSY